MGWIAKLGSLAKGMMGRRDLEDRMSDEFRFHIEEYVNEHVAEGVPREVAERRARVEFGGAEAVKEDCRQARGLGWFDEIRQDLSFGLRSLERNRGFAVTAIVTLALGIGATTAIFSVVYAVLIRPLPYPEPDRLVRVEVLTQALFGPGGVRTGPLLVNDFPEVRDRAESLVDLSLYGQVAHTLTGQGEPVRLSGAEVSPSLFRLLGARPTLGRLLEPGDEQPGNDRVVVLSNRTWVERFGADGGIVGRTIRLDEDVHTVVGVMESAFGFPDPGIEFWKPANPEPVFSLGGGNFVFVAAGPAIARLADGVSVERAEAEVESIVRSLHSAEMAGPESEEAGAGIEIGRPPGFSDPFSAAEINLAPIQEEMVRGVRPALLVLFGAVVFVLLIACVNVANLLLSRSNARQVEVGVRAALGAGRLRLVRQVLTESLLLAAGGGLVGTLVAAVAIRLLGATGPEWLPRLEEIALDRSVLAFAAGATIVTGLLFGLAPALRLSRIGTSWAINEGRAQASSGAALGRHPVRGTLVVAQVALAVVLLVGGGLLIHSFRNLADTPLGYDPENVLSFVVALPEGRYAAGESRRDFHDQLLARLDEHPAVVSAAAANALPTSGIMLIRSMVFDGEATSTRHTEVTPAFFETLRIPVVEGRSFTDRDLPGSILINEAFAREFFPGGAVGRPLPGPAGEMIIGVVGDISRPANVADSTRNAIYSALDASNGSPIGAVPVTVVVRTRDQAPNFIAEARRIVAEIDPQLAIDQVQTLEATLSASIAEPRFYAVALGIFAGVALSLAAVGIYGVMAYAVTQRTREIGIRMALGARRPAVMKLVLVQGLAMTSAGLVIGLAGAMAVTRYLDGMLFGLTPLDPATFVAMTIVLVGVALLACGIPARRAVRIDPSSALRHE